MGTTIEILELKALVAVIRQGTFTAAAETLSTDKAHVSRIVSRLEKKLGARLLQRSTRRLHVTETGREFFERASGVLMALEETEAVVSRSNREPSGTLRITAGAEFGAARVTAWIATYLELYPDVRVDATYTNRITDIIHEGIDVAVRVGTLADSELSARRLGEIEYGLFASPAYVDTHKDPRDPAELSDHDLIVFAPRPASSWRLVKGKDFFDVKREPRIVVDSNQAARDLAIAGLGITLVPKFMATDAVDADELVGVLTGWSQAPIPVHAVFASSRYLAPKVRAFVDLAAERFEP
ncbi:MAG: LysR family transcriptional regulator [Woeseiaceae bacterium]|nr:LysR family transcriptional regulator [Woeseiaceae bacterium]